MDLRQSPFVARGLWSHSPLPSNLRKALLYLKSKSPFYAPIIQAVMPKDPERWTWEAFFRLPLSGKSDLARFNDRFLCVSSRQIQEWTSTSGTTGTPVYVGLTEKDLRRLAQNEAWTFTLAGLRRGDVMQIMITLDKRFMAGLAYWLGARRLGISVVRCGPGMAPVQWAVMSERRVTSLLAVPSFLLRLLDYAESRGKDPSGLSVRTLIAVGEPTLDDGGRPNALAREILSRWPLKIVSTYASTELQTAFTECPAGQGLHAQDELVFSEVLDEDGNPVPDGVEGQLVFTHLGVEGMPLLRYATGDMVRVWYSPCSCGLTSLRIGPVRGRKERRLKFNGTTVYPEQYVAAMTDAGYLGNFQLRLSRLKDNHDHMTLVLPSCSTEPVSEEKIALIFQQRALPVPEIIRIPEDELKQALFPENQRKPMYILDQRI